MAEPGWKEMTLAGWGRNAWARVRAARPERRREAVAALAAADARGILARGAGRSYGDAALNDGGRLILTGRLDRILAFDADSGEIAVEPGVSFGDLLEVFLPRGFLVPVSPGTAFATIGGAVANDVHGKNHETAGSFGAHVRWLDLLLPSGETVRCSPVTRPALFEATLGGIGLTGIVLAVCFRMSRVPSDAIMLRERRIADLEDFLAAFEDQRVDEPYSVGWIDALARGAALGRGILETGGPAAEGAAVPSARTLALPCDLPTVLLNRGSVRAFNEIYWRRVPAGGRQRRIGCSRFLYPLDAIRDWNRLYGKPGFRQFQCVVPLAEGAYALRRMLETVAAGGNASFLAVLKRMGDEGRGLLSFAMPGYSLALDIPERSGTTALLAQLERIARDHGGRIYLAKDSALSPEGFAEMYPNLARYRSVLETVDPGARLQSDMARRLRVRGSGA
jgi:decaprenylphospho-beta-D-ribofuranose 2-oxidase